MTGGQKKAAYDWHLENSQKVVSRASTLKKRILPCERAWNTEPAKGVRNRVHFCLRPLMHLERCGRVLRNRKVILSYLKQKWLTSN